MKFKPLRNGSPKTSSRSRRRVAIVAILSGLVLAVAVGVMGVSPKPSTAQGKKYKATKEIVRDQATGALRKPTDAETDAMVAQISVLTNRSSEGLVVQQAPNGMKVIDAEGRFNSVTLGRAKADGTTEIRCVFSLDEAADFLGFEETE